MVQSESIFRGMIMNSILNGVFLVLLASAAVHAETRSDSVTAATPSSPSPSSVAAHPLPFKPGDALEIVTFPDTAGFPSGFYPIDGEGFVDFPIIGYTKVTEMSCEALAKLLAEKYVDFMRYPHMKIRPAIRVALNGGFFRPGLYWIDPHATLWEAIQKAGGTQRMDGFKKLKWERNNLIVSKDLVPVIEEGKSLYQIGFKTGDQLTVLQQQHRTNWEVFRMDVVPLITVSLSTVISALTLYNTMQYYRSR